MPRPPLRPLNQPFAPRGGEGASGASGAAVGQALGAATASGPLVVVPFALNTPGAIDWSLGMVNDIAQNVRMILSIPKGSVPLNRDFGIDPSFLDLPWPAAQQMYVAASLLAIRRWEPRARFQAASFATDNVSGTVFAQIRLAPIAGATS